MFRKEIIFRICSFLLLMGLPAPVLAISFETLSQFDGTVANEPSRLIQGPDGGLYGTSYNGGSNGQGSVFKVGTNGAVTTVYSFTNGVDGYFPVGGLVLGTNDMFYGVTFGGGNPGPGTVYQVTTNGVLTVLHTFYAFVDGGNPMDGLVFGTNGMLYGTTLGDGAQSVVFGVTISGGFTNLHTFTGGDDGETPLVGLTLSSSGDLYGMTSYGAAITSGQFSKSERMDFRQSLPLIL
jgi:uncharacterized repeat protein (TIGR03803 family)